MLETILLLIFIRPFISSLAYPGYNFVFTVVFILAALLYCIIKKPECSRVKAAAMPVMVFLSVLFLNAILVAADKQRALTEVCFYAASIVALTVSATLPVEKRITFIRILILSATVVSCIALYQYAFGFAHTSRYVAEHPEYASDFMRDYLSRKRVFAPFVTPNILGGYLAMILMITVKNKYARIAIVPMIAALLLTTSLGAFFSLGAGILLYMFLKGTLKTKHLSILVLILVCSALLFMWRTLFSPGHAQPLFSGSMRLAYWSDSLTIIFQHPFMGIGLGNFNLGASRYAHNLILQFWAETGLAGMLALCWLLIAIFRKAIATVRDGAARQEYVPALILCATSVFLIHNLIDFSFFLPEVSLLWWGLLGILL